MLIVLSISHTVSTVVIVIELTREIRLLLPVLVHHWFIPLLTLKGCCAHLSCNLSSSERFSV